MLPIEKETIPRTAITWEPEGKRKRGIPRETWRQTEEKELKVLGLESWTEAPIVARDRDRWRKMISCQSSQLGEKEVMVIQYNTIAL